MEFNKTSYDDTKQWEEVKCTGTITILYLVTELLPFVTFSCTENKLENYWTESNKTSYNGKAQWEAVQCTRTIALIWANYIVIALSYSFLVRRITFIALFSSPEHEVLKASYCDRLLSGVCSASSVNIFSSVPSGSLWMKLHRKHPLNDLNRVPSYFFSNF